MDFAMLRTHISRAIAARESSPVTYLGVKHFGVIRIGQCSNAPGEFFYMMSLSENK